MQMKDIQDGQDLISYGEEFFDSSAKAKRKQERQWLLNLAFLAGDQLVKVNRHTGMLDRTPVEYDPDWVVRIVDNRILPVYRTVTSKLGKNNPLPDAKAHSREDSDIQAARAAIKLEEYHWQQLKLDAIHPEMLSWLATTGNCFYKQFWNPKKGERIVDDDPRMLELMDSEKGLTEQGVPQTEDNNPLDKFIDINTGDTDLILRTPFNVYPQPGKKRLADMTIIGDAEVLDAQDVYDIYGVEVQGEKETKLTALNTNLESTLSGNNQSMEVSNPVTVKELYIMPCKRFTEGIKYRWAGGKMLGKPEKCRSIQEVFTHFGLLFVPGHFWYKGIVDDLIPIQRRWNQLLSKIEMHNDYYNDPPIFYDSSRINVDDWTSEPGSFIESLMQGTDLRGAVVPLQVPTLDPAIFKELEILDQQFEIIPVVNKVSFGKDTSNATSGKAINFLQEKDDDIVRPLISNIESGYAQVFKNDFKLCQENYDEDRGFAIVGEDNKVEWVDFKKADLKANVDITVEAGSAMPRSKAAQQTMVMDMLNAGFFTDPRTGKPDFAKALKYMEFGSVDDIYQDNALDTNQAQRENERMKEGQEVTVEEWHNHEAHYYEHNRMRKTADYEQLSDDAKQMFNNHCLQHQEFMKPPQKPEPQPQPVNGGQQLPSDQEVVAFMQFLKQNYPQIAQQLAALPEEQQTQAVLQLMQQMGGGAAQPGQQPQAQPQQQSIPGPVQ